MTPQFICTLSHFVEQPVPGETNPTSYRNGAPMALSHECECIFEDHIVVLQAAYANRLQAITLRLYVDNVCVDQRTVSTYDMARHTLRGRLRVSPAKQVAVTGTLTLGWLKKPHYGLFVNNEVIHEETGPWHSL